MKIRAWICWALPALLIVAACGGESAGPDPEDDYETPVVTTVSVTPAALSLIEGQSGSFSVRAEDQNGNELSSSGVVWTSSDPSVATVSSGAVQAVRPGSVTIMARVGSVTGTGSLQVGEFEEPDLLAQGETMEGYLAPGALDSIGLDIDEEARVQYFGSVSGGELGMVLRQPDGTTRGQVSIDGSGNWYSAVYVGAPASYFTTQLPEAAPSGVHYTFGVAVIDTLPESRAQAIAAGDTIRGELLGPPNGDRDTFIFPTDGATSARLHVRFGPEWVASGRSLRVFSVGVFDPAEEEGWAASQIFPLADEEHPLQFLIQQPWGEEFSLPLEFVVELVDEG